MDVSLKRFVPASLMLFTAWLLMAGSLQWQELVVGAAAAMTVSYLSLARLRFLDDLLPGLALPWHVAHYLVVFLRALIASNLDMARRVLAPSLPIYPSIMEVQTQLRSPLGRLLLANSITLTPGTLTVEVTEDRLRVHWIDARDAEDLAATTRIIAERFETALGRFVR